MSERNRNQSIVGNGNIQVGGNAYGNLQADPGSREGQSRQTPDTRLRILFLGVNSAGSPTLRIEDEVHAIDRVLLEADAEGRLELIQKFAVRPSEIQTHLLRYEPRILHFSGHAFEEGLVLRTESGRGRPVGSAPLAQLLGHFRHHLQCVVLNGCSTEESARCIAERIDCVIGMSADVQDLVAIRFAVGFYRALAFGRDLRTAFDLGCGEVGISGLEQADLPRMFLRTGASEKLFPATLPPA